MSQIFDPNDVPYIIPLEGDRYEIHFPPLLKKILNEQAAQLKNELSSETDLHPNLMRLNPPASLNDFQRAIDFNSLHNFSIRNTHLTNLQILIDTENEANVTEDAVASIAQAINSIRLFLGTELGIDQGDTDNILLNQSGSYHLYLLLGYLLDEIVTVISGQN